jgi:type I restriction enzyme R subunit
LVLGDDAFAQTDQAVWVGQAKEIDAVVQQAVAEHSLNPQNIEAAIRKALLPKLFGLMGLDRAKEAIDQMIQVTRVGLARGGV